MARMGGRRVARQYRVRVQCPGDRYEREVKWFTLNEVWGLTSEQVVKRALTRAHRGWKGGKTGRGRVPPGTKVFWIESTAEGSTLAPGVNWRAKEER